MTTNWVSIAFFIGLAYLVIRSSKWNEKETSLVYARPWSGQVPAKRENFSDRVLDLEVDTDE